MKTKEYKTPFDYKIMYKGLVDEFKELFDAYIDAEHLGIYRKFSSNYNFYIDGGAFRILSRVSRGGRKDTAFNQYKTLFYNGTSGYKTYAYDSWDMDCTSAQGRKVQNFFRGKFHDTMFDLKFTEEKFSDLVKSGRLIYDQNYSKKELVEYNLKYNLEAVLQKTFHKYMSPMDYHGFHVSDDEGKYITFSYRNSDVKMKSGKAIRKLLKCFDYSCTDEELKIMVNRLTCNFDGFILKVVDGDDIDKYYNGENYDDVFDTGSLGNSCMRDACCGEDGFFQIYKDNCQMLILINEERDVILGRAILWKAKDRNTGDTVNVMDRIYSNEKVYQRFFDWAKENNCYRKRYQSYDNSTSFVAPSGMDEEMDFEIKISLDDYNNLPYMDTFAWGDNYYIRNDDCFGHYTARGTSGELEGRDDNDNDDDDDEYYDKW